jgi:hypothetical protein
LLKKAWGETEIRQLLKYIKEGEGIQRGYIGQSIYAIIDYLNDNVNILGKIAFDNNTDEDSSYWAFIMYLYSYQFDHKTDDVIELIDKYLNKFPKSTNYEIISDLKKIFYEYGRFDIY